MYKNKIAISLQELKVQIALGTLPKEYRIKPCQNTPLSKVKRTRHCHFCGDALVKGTEFYWAYISGIRRNICKDCSWLSIQSILKKYYKEE